MLDLVVWWGESHGLVEEDSGGLDGEGWSRRGPVARPRVGKVAAAREKWKRRRYHRATWARHVEGVSTEEAVAFAVAEDRPVDAADLAPVEHEFVPLPAPRPPLTLSEIM
eukprot:SAG22_NODE_171_length_16646_cov_6.580528_7_plen_110_part_00